MKKLPIILMILICVTAVFAQKKETKKTIFAVVNDGKQIEPIAFIENGELKTISGENGEAEKNNAYLQSLYKPKAKFNLIFGGANAGTVTVIKNFADSDCAANQAEISIQSKTVKPKGFLMALATNALSKKKVSGLRKLPTVAERAEIEKLVMAEMIKQKIPIKKTGELRYHNLTKIDADNDGNPEFVGTFWYNTGAKIRSLMFFIAEKTADGKYSIPFSKFDEFKEDEVMSKDLSNLDKDGIYHEFLIDLFDIDGNGTGEIFTISSGFEGSNFNAYRKTGGKWTEILDTSNYHCGY